jgi:hypothetical protein
MGRMVLAPLVAVLITGSAAAQDGHEAKTYADVPVTLFDKAVEGDWAIFGVSSKSDEDRAEKAITTAHESEYLLMLTVKSIDEKAIVLQGTRVGYGDVSPVTTRSLRRPMKLSDLFPAAQPEEVTSLEMESETRCSSGATFSCKRVTIRSHSEATQSRYLVWVSDAVTGGFVRFESHRLKKDRLNPGGSESSFCMEVMGFGHQDETTWLSGVKGIPCPSRVERKEHEGEK